MKPSAAFYTPSSHAIFLLSQQLDEELFAEGIVVCSGITPQIGCDAKAARVAHAGIPHEILRRRWWVTHGGVEGLAKLRAAVEAAGVQILPDTDTEDETR